MTLVGYKASKATRIIQIGKQAKIEADPFQVLDMKSKSGT